MPPQRVGTRSEGCAKRSGWWHVMSTPVIRYLPLLLHGNRENSKSWRHKYIYIKIHFLQIHISLSFAPPGTGGARVWARVPSPKDPDCLLPPCAKQVGKECSKYFGRKTSKQRVLSPVLLPPSAFQSVCIHGAGTYIKQMFMKPRKWMAGQGHSSEYLLEIYFYI